MSREGNETLHRCKLAEHNYRHRKWKRLFLLVEVISFLGAVSLTGDLLYRFGWVYLAETFSKQDRLLLVIFAVMAMYGNAIFVVMKLVGVSKKYPEPLTIFFVVGTLQISFWTWLLSEAKSEWGFRTSVFNTLILFPELLLTGINLKAMLECPRCY